MLKKFLFLSPDAAGDAAGGAGAAPANGGNGAANEPRKFSQEELNAVLAREKKAWKEQQEKLLSDVEGLKKAKNLTDEQRAQLETRAQELENALLTEQEKAQKEIAKREREFKEQLENSAKEMSQWKARYSDSTIEGEITQAAAVEKAVNPAQIIALVKPLASIVEEKDAAHRATGRFKTVVKVAEAGEVRDVPVAEYVKLMKADKANVNLFYSERPGGTGYRPGAGGVGAQSNLTSAQKIAAGLKGISAE